MSFNFETATFGEALFAIGKHDKNISEANKRYEASKRSCDERKHDLTDKWNLPFTLILAVVFIVGWYLLNVSIEMNEATKVATIILMAITVSVVNSHFRKFAKIANLPFHQKDATNFAARQKECREAWNTLGDAITVAQDDLSDVSMTFSEEHPGLALCIDTDGITIKFSRFHNRNETLVKMLGKDENAPLLTTRIQTAND